MNKTLLSLALLGSLFLVQGGTVHAAEVPNQVLSDQALGLDEASKRRAADDLTRVCLIKVKPDMLEEYKAFLKEGAETAMRVEPGVLLIYATNLKDDPTRWVLLEIYRDQPSYESHIVSPHFQKYKQGTLHMVESLEILDSNPLLPGLKLVKE